MYDKETSLIIVQNVQDASFPSRIILDDKNYMFDLYIVIYILNAIGGEAHVICEGSTHMNLVLVVPSLSSNLLSISQITKTSNCFVTFWPDKCVF